MLAYLQVSAFLIFHIKANVLLSTRSGHCKGPVVFDMGKPAWPILDPSPVLPGPFLAVMWQTTCKLHRNVRGHGLTL